MVVSMLFALATAQPVSKYFPDPVPQVEYTRSRAPSGPHILYLNFDGAHLTSGFCNNSRTNCSNIVMGSSYDFPAYTGDRATITQQVQQFYAPFNVQIVTTRPTSGDYSMTMIGDGAGVLGPGNSGAAGIAPLDCGDNNQDDISFAFTGGEDAFSIAVTIAQESAHAFGLGHTNNRRDIMYPVLVGSETGFANQDMLVCDYGPGFPNTCSAGSDCTGTGHQNSYQLLMANVGAGGPDVTPPTIGFSQPHDGDMVASMFKIVFDANDDRGVASVDLFVDGAMVNTVGASPWSFDIAGGTLSAGAHKLKGVAKDMAGNVADSGEITVTVQPLGANPGEIGSSCNNDADCPQGGFCAFDSGANTHFCTRTCDMMANPCPMGFECVNGGGPMVCAPSTGMGGGSSGGCEVADAARHGSPLAGILLLGLGAFALVLARARRS